MTDPPGDPETRRVDRTSQRLLLSLSEGSETAPELRDELGLEQTQQIHYRVDAHLSDWVEAVGEEERPGATRDATVYGLTDAGDSFVEGRRSEWEDPATLSETREAAREALSDASSAKKKADTARKNYSELKREVEELQDRVDELPDSGSVNSMLAGKATQIERRMNENEPWNGDVEAVADRVDGLERRLNAVEEMLQDDPWADDIDEVEDGLQSRLNAVEETSEDAHEYLADLQSRGILGRLRWVLTGS